MIVFTVLLPCHLHQMVSMHQMDYPGCSGASSWVVKYFKSKPKYVPFFGNTKRGVGLGDHIVHSPHASMGLATMLLGVSGSWEDMEATSLPVELEPGPPSEKLTCEKQVSCWKAG